MRDGSPLSSPYKLSSHIQRLPFPLLSSPHIQLVVKGGPSEVKKLQLLDLLGWTYTAISLPASSKREKSSVANLSNTDLNSDLNLKADVADGCSLPPMEEISRIDISDGIGPLQLTESIAKHTALDIAHELKLQERGQNSDPSLTTSPSPTTATNNNKEYIILTTHHVAVCQSIIKQIPKSSTELKLFLTNYSNQKVMIVTTIITTSFPSLKQAIDNDIAIIQFKEIEVENILKLSTQKDLLNSIGGINLENIDLCKNIRYIEGTLDSFIGMPVNTIQRLIMNVITTNTSNTKSYDSNDIVGGSGGGRERGSDGNSVRTAGSNTPTVNSSVYSTNSQRFDDNHNIITVTTRPPTSRTASGRSEYDSIIGGHNSDRHVSVGYNSDSRRYSPSGRVTHNSIRYSSPSHSSNLMNQRPFDTPTTPPTTPLDYTTSTTTGAAVPVPSMADLNPDQIAISNLNTEDSVATKPSTPPSVIITGPSAVTDAAQGTKYSRLITTLYYSYTVCVLLKNLCMHANARTLYSYC